MRTITVIDINKLFDALEVSKKQARYWKGCTFIITGVALYSVMQVGKRNDALIKKVRELKDELREMELKEE